MADSFRSAIELANVSTGKADTIRFDAELTGAVIFLSPGNAPLTFEPGARTTVDGTDLGISVDGMGVERFNRVFNVESGAKADIKNLTIENGILGSDLRRIEQLPGLGYVLPDWHLELSGLHLGSGKPHQHQRSNARPACPVAINAA
ncbi:MAG: hypothetical protein EXS09_02855 [Gemmataceae bacterium]|nr:hypothetical protein [Gemmataceae bacterium]